MYSSHSHSAFQFAGVVPPVVFPSSSPAMVFHIKTLGVCVVCFSPLPSPSHFFATSARSRLNSITYIRKYHSQPVGFSELNPNNESDKILIRQNNCIIYLLLNINKKLDNLIENRDISQNNSISEIINKLDNLTITSSDRKVQKKPVPWKFFRVKEE